MSLYHACIASPTVYRTSHGIIVQTYRYTSRFKSCYQLLFVFVTLCGGCFCISLAVSQQFGFLLCCSTSSCRILISLLHRHSSLWTPENSFFVSQWNRSVRLIFSWHDGWSMRGNSFITSWWESRLTCLIWAWRLNFDLKEQCMFKKQSTLKVIKGQQMLLQAQKGLWGEKQVGYFETQTCYMILVCMSSAVFDTKSLKVCVCVCVCVCVHMLGIVIGNCV